MDWSKESYVGRRDTILEVLLREYAVTTAEDKRHVLATGYTAICIRVWGYEPDLKIGFLAHYDTIGSTRSLEDMLREVSEYTHGQDHCFDVHIDGGWKYWPVSEFNAWNLERRLRGQDIISTKLTRHPLQHFGEDSTFALDTKNGTEYSCDRTENLYRRGEEFSVGRLAYILFNRFAEAKRAEPY